MALVAVKYIQGFKMVFLSVLAFMGLLGLHNCGEPDTPAYECTSDITVLLPEKAVSTFFFKEGSYWVYQREDSLYVDSVWVTWSKQEVLPIDIKSFPTFKKEKCYEARSTTLKSLNNYFFDSNNYILQNRAPKEVGSYEEEVFVVYDGWKKTSDIRLDFVGNETEIINAYGDSVFHKDSLNVIGTWYYDIFHYERSSQRPDYLKEAYYSSGYGMIRFKDNNDSWWNLMRCNIVQ
ncbi:MAG: hypothetical protein LPK48_00610 [Bacteroidota bacterium]|nr:hypothetical protein [Bacteroidota bacterium]